MDRAEYMSLRIILSPLCEEVGIQLYHIPTGKLIGKSIKNRLGIQLRDSPENSNFTVCVDGDDFNEPLSNIGFKLISGKIISLELAYDVIALIETYIKH